ncbi:Ribosomal small subunit pseudouridine synthase [Alteracholeplasma palmae J233]|uniref:Ribosomal small subunit pseudouridine synthase n=1 Tax=Alteracholeplasma palmae (strain ATCC 49389 / J233) TaxID=1318466 RepID=U4KK02_ALTPJ|nr:pseudouridine synthase [Alteracholeplasma palmae]CCV63823.1 Ribosomal small subunit pseudouridine synthase [Alteracholeplasma palmae J233]
MKRLDQFLSQLKYGSRKEVNELIKKKIVKINQNRVLDGKTKFDPLRSIVTIDGTEVYYRENIYLMMNKPSGYLSSNIDEKYPSVLNLLEDKYKRFDFKIAGRLDWDSEGLLILVTESKLVHEITHPSKNKEKIYKVKLDKAYDETLTTELLDGVMIKDGNNEIYKAIATFVRKENEDVLIGITEGKFHQVKRMFEKIGYKVEKLTRIQVGNLKLGSLKLGETKEITRNELF